MKPGGKVLIMGGAVLLTFAIGRQQLFSSQNSAKEDRKFPSFGVFDDSTMQRISTEKVVKKINDMTFDELTAYIDSCLGVNPKKSSLPVPLDSADKFAAEKKQLADSVTYAKKLEENKLLSQKDSTDNANLLEKNKLLTQKDSVENARQTEFSRLKAMRDSVDNAARLFEKQMLVAQKDSLESAKRQAELRNKTHRDSVESAQKLEKARLTAQKDSVEKANDDAALKFEAEQEQLQKIYVSIIDRMWEVDGLSPDRLQTLKKIVAFVEENAGRLKVELGEDFAELKSRVIAREKHFANEKMLMENEKKRREGLEIIEPLPLGHDSSAIKPNNVVPADTVKKVDMDTAGSVVPSKEQIETGPLFAPGQNTEKKPVNGKKTEPPQIRKEETTGKEIVE